VIHEKDELQGGGKREKKMLTMIVEEAPDCKANNILDQIIQEERDKHNPTPQIIQEERDKHNPTPEISMPPNFLAENFDLLSTREIASANTSLLAPRIALLSPPKKQVLDVPVAQEIEMKEDVQGELEPMKKKGGGFLSGKKKKVVIAAETEVDTRNVDCSAPAHRPEETSHTSVPQAKRLVTPQEDEMNRLAKRKRIEAVTENHVNTLPATSGAVVKKPGRMKLFPLPKK